VDARTEPSKARGGQWISEGPSVRREERRRRERGRGGAGERGGIGVGAVGGGDEKGDGSGRRTRKGRRVCWDVRCGGSRKRKEEEKGLYQG